MKFVAYFIFGIVQILSLPFAIIGGLLVFYKQMYVSKRLGVSSTAIEIINGRWIMDKFGLRKDTATVQLNKVLPNSSTTGLWLALFPLYLLRKLTGKNNWFPVYKEAGMETIADLVTARTRFIDEILETSLAASEQFVVLGAGFDTRCYGDLAKDHLTLFELDQRNTQSLKVNYLKEAKIDASRVHFVEVDFASENWYNSIVAAGFDEQKKTTFLWEGVTLYLAEGDVRNTLNKIKERSLAGSHLIVDFYANTFVNGELFPGMKKSLQVLKMTDEELAFGLPFAVNALEALSSFIQSENMSLGEVHFMGNQTKKGTWMAVAELIV